MRIGFSAFVLQGGRSGVASYVVNLLAAMQELENDDTFDILLPGADRALIPLRNPRFRHTAVRPAFCPPVPSLLWHNLVLPTRTRRERYDLLHVPSYRRIPWRKAAPVVATVHDLATLRLDHKYDAARMFFNRRVVPSLIRRTDRVIAVSEFTKRDILEFVGYPADRITVIYHGIDHALFCPLPPGEARARLAAKYGLAQPFMVYVSRLEHPAKNHVRLIEAYERLQARRRTGVQLVLAGADWNGAEVIRARAAQSPEAANILLPGFVPREDLPDFYAACELMVYPSLFEGFGFPIVEAQACGADVICSNTSSMRELAGDRLPTFDPENVEELTAVLEAALARGPNPARRAEALAYAARFQWAETARQVRAVYAQTLKEAE